MTLIDIVKRYRIVFKTQFIDSALELYPKKTAKFSAYYEKNDVGFEEATITVSGDGPSHDGIYASNTVQDDCREAVIIISPDLYLPKEKPYDEVERKRTLKMVLAHEWLEVMQAFEDREREKKKVLNKIDTILMLDSLQQRTIWQDSSGFEKQMHLALRELLISRDSIIKRLQELHEVSVKDLKALIQSDSNEAASIIRNVEKHFSSTANVNQSAVSDRIIEILL